MKLKLLAPILGMLLLFGACSAETPPQTPASMTPAASTSDQSKTLTPMPVPTPAPAPAQNQLDPPKIGEKIVVIETDLGKIKMRIFTKDVPELSKNFLKLALDGKYKNVLFHRVVKNFMIQTGDFTNKDGTGGYSYKGPGTMLPNEINPAYKHLYGTVSMAKSPLPVSIGSQFFIVTNKNGAPFLDGNFSPFAQVYEGMDVAEKIADLQIPGTEKPKKLIKIKKVSIILFTNPKSAR